MIQNIRVQMMGGLSVTADAEELIGLSDEIGKQWQLFCFVLLNKNAPCTQTRLTANLWRGLTPADPTKTLAATLDALNKSFGCKDPSEGPILFADELFIRNPRIEFELDTEVFETSCQDAAKHEGKEKLDMYTKAAALYTGALLPQLDSEIWVTPLARYFAKLYMECVISLCTRLEENELFTKLLETATAASLLEPLEEQYFVYIFRALKALDMHRVIIPTYHRAARTFMEELGIPLNDEIRTIYEAASDHVDAVDQDVMVIRDDLLEIMNESRGGSGPLYCSYDVFKYLYQVVARSSERAGRTVAILLLSLIPADGEEAANSKTVSSLMSQVKLNVLNGVLRRSDTVARFSQNQHIIMLSVDSKEGAKTVLQRITVRCEPILEMCGMKARAVMAEIEPPGEGEK